MKNQTEQKLALAYWATVVAALLVYTFKISP